MKRCSVFMVLLTAFYFISCSTEKHNFPVNKEYWDVNDYDKVIFDLRYTYEGNETKPTFDNPEQRIVLEKLINPENYKKFLDDAKLDLNQKNQIASEFLSQWKDMNQIYNVTNTNNRYLYGKEMLEIWQFGLGLQLAAFDLKFDQVLANSKNVEDKELDDKIKPSIKKLIINYDDYLNLAAKENSFFEKEKETYARGIDKYFKELIQVYPDADYDRLLKKAMVMLERAESTTIKKPLKNLIALINAQKNNKAEA
ncbi:hypothetical protein [Tenacibaculum jejuense]|uniref:Probable lipoprotein n=1 Tax=Tenacibaculum jejuense TaxID=584609 RepID=A0A238UBQ8_9FLAO|nr:hypothetical protein [Tenacibaculum jejuense]SNR16416.1 Probable lipoprotein precursor [Tenacibaculum jejuense]